MLVFSILEMFKIGVGPSSSHTVGPMVAAHEFVTALERDGSLERVGRVRTVLYGSLALTGLGHGTDRATVAGLEGNMPQSVDTDHVNTIRQECERSGELSLNGTHRIPFDYAHDVVMDVWHRGPSQWHAIPGLRCVRQSDRGTGLVFHRGRIRPSRIRRGSDDRHPRSASGRKRLFGTGR